MPGFLSYRERKRNPARVKSDPADAVAIARVVARGEGLCSPQPTDILVELKLLSDHRDQLVRARTQLINRTHKDLVISHPGYEKKIPKLNSKKAQAAAISLLRGDRSVRAELIRDRIAEIQRATKKIGDAEQLIAAKVAESGTTLTMLPRDRICRRCEDPGRGRGPVTSPVQGRLRDDDRDGSHRSLAGDDQEASSQSRWESSAELRPPHDGAVPDPP